MWKIHKCTHIPSILEHIEKPTFSVQGEKSKSFPWHKRESMMGIPSLSLFQFNIFDGLNCAQTHLQSKHPPHRLKQKHKACIIITQKSLHSTEFLYLTLNWKYKCIDMYTTLCGSHVEILPVIPQSFSLAGKAGAFSWLFYTTIINRNSV